MGLNSSHHSLIPQIQTKLAFPLPPVVVNRAAVKLLKAGISIIMAIARRYKTIAFRESLSRPAPSASPKVSTTPTSSVQTKPSKYIITHTSFLHFYP